MEPWEIAFDDFQNKDTNDLNRFVGNVMLQLDSGNSAMEKFKELYRSLHSLGDVATFYYSDLAATLKVILSHENAWEIFTMLTPEAQFKVIEEIDSYSEEIPMTLMISSILAGCPDFSLVDLSLYGAEIFAADIRSQKEDIFHGIESESFIENCYHFIAPLIDSTSIATVFLLRRAYGEDTINEILHRSLTEETRISMNDLLRISYSWSAVKDFPIEWGVTVATETQDIICSLIAEINT